MSGAREQTANPLERPCLRMRHILTFAALAAVVAGAFGAGEKGQLYAAVVGAILSGVCNV